MIAIKSGVSENTVDSVMNDARFLSKVIEYDRYQPEFYEDTFTYINKRASSNKVSKGLCLYKKQYSIIKEIEKNFLSKKNYFSSDGYRLALSYGKYLGKMDIISSLATLSYDRKEAKCIFYQ